MFSLMHLLRSERKIEVNVYEVYWWYPWGCLTGVCAAEAFPCSPAQWHRLSGTEYSRPHGLASQPRPPGLLSQSIIKKHVSAGRVGGNGATVKHWLLENGLINSINCIILLFSTLVSLYISPYWLSFDVSMSVVASYCCSSVYLNVVVKLSFEIRARTIITERVCVWL